MSHDPGKPRVLKELMLERFRTYDEHVDVVSALEWLFTESQQLPETILHFERFPKVALAPGKIVTPDFTVAFKDGTGLVGEIARIGLHENSVDKLCSQIGRYDAVANLPGPDGTSISVKSVEVLLLLPFSLGPDAARRILDDRVRNPDHGYQPKRHPCLVVYAREEGSYNFQLSPHPDNGHLPDSSDTTIGFFLKTNLKVPAQEFKGVKARRSLMNDEVDPLYLATLLLTKLIPTLCPGFAAAEVEAAELASALHTQHGKGRATDVRHALELLERAALARRNADGTWTVIRPRLGRSGRDIAAQIATRATSRDTKPLAARPDDTASRRTDQQGSLFEA